MMQHLIRLAGLGLIVALTGCGGDNSEFHGKNTATVTGKVILANGQPLPGGTITFHSTADASKAAGAEISPEGTYTATGVPHGECKVTVENAHLASITAQPLEGVPTPKYVRIDGKYAKPATSGLSTNVQGREHKYDVQLK